MAQKRMLDKKISVSEQVANLSPVGQLIFTWSIPHADDIGLLPESHRTLRGTICPLLDLTLEDFSKHVETIVAEGLWSKFEFSGKKFYRLCAFGNHQSLKRDRQPNTILPIVHFKNAQDTWKLLEDIGFQMETEEKGSKEKRREENTLFDRVWAIYPKKVGKAEAKRAFDKLKADEELTDRIVSAIALAKTTSQWTDNEGRYVPHCATYLNQRRFEDELPPPKPVITGYEITEKGARPVLDPEVEKLRASFKGKVITRQGDDITIPI